MGKLYALVWSKPSACLLAAVTDPLGTALAAQIRYEQRCTIWLGVGSGQTPNQQVGMCLMAVGKVKDG